VRVLVFSQYYPPEIGAGPTRVHTFAAGLARRGHEVEVVCEVPNHPQGVIQPGYRRLVERRELDGVKVTYLRVVTAPRKTLLTRLGFYGSYVTGASAAGVFRRTPDVVFASSPPLPVGIPGALAARRYGRPLILDVRDLWPEAAVSMGELTNPRLVAMLDRLARALYREAAVVTTPTEPFAAAIAAKSTARPEVLPNGTTPLWLEAAELAPDRGALGLPEDAFVWTYAGTLNASQELEYAVEAAALLGHGFHLHVVGEGPERPKLERLARERPGASISFHAQVPPARAAEILRASDAGLVSVSAKPGPHGSVPVKLYDYGAVGRPVLLAGGGEARRVAEANRCALVVAQGRPAAMADGIRRLRDDPALREQLVRDGRDFAEQNQRERQVERLESLMLDLVR
jgi:glycosyltransferase involved in cell wall biosynthesis